MTMNHDEEKILGIFMAACFDDSTITQLVKGQIEKESDDIHIRKENKHEN